MKLKNISLNYEDGTTKTFNTGELSNQLRTALTEAGFYKPTSEISKAKNYIVMQWGDGWKEVMAVNSDFVDLIRYYVIRRIEDRGRIALDTRTGYPELIVIERQPKEMCRMMIINGKKVKSYGLETEIERYEGIFEDGGKKEYKKFERGEPFFTNQIDESGDNLDDIKNAVSETLKKLNILPDELINMDTDLRMVKYKDIARVANIYGFKSEGDVYGFIELILKNLMD